ncbi:MAG: hypothetical protein M3Q44_06215 [bacterium]|nr:hypothetical protein [bacterium]
MAKGSIEVLQNIAGSQPKITEVSPGERFTQHEIKLLGVVPIFRRTVEPLTNGKVVTANTYFGMFRSGVGRRATLDGDSVATAANSLLLEDVVVRKPEERRKTYSVL